MKWKYSVRTPGRQGEKVMTETVVQGWFVFIYLFHVKDFEL